MPAAIRRVNNRTFLLKRSLVEATAVVCCDSDGGASMNAVNDPPEVMEAAWTVYVTEV